MLNQWKLGHFDSIVPHYLTPTILSFHPFPEDSTTFQLASYKTRPTLVYTPPQATPTTNVKQLGALMTPVVSIIMTNPEAKHLGLLSRN